MPDESLASSCPTSPSSLIVVVAFVNAGRRTDGLVRFGSHHRLCVRREEIQTRESSRGISWDLRQIEAQMML